MEKQRVYFGNLFLRTTKAGLALSGTVSVKDLKAALEKARAEGIMKDYKGEEQIPVTGFMNEGCRFGLYLDEYKPKQQQEPEDAF